MIDSMILSWGLLSLTAGTGFFARPEFFLRIQRLYDKKVWRERKRLVKSHRRTGRVLILLGFILTFTYLCPEWITYAFALARVVYLMVNPQPVIPVEMKVMTPPTLWI